MAGLLLGTVIFSAGSGLAEVLTSPTVSAVPSSNGERLLSRLHASYAWGVVAVVPLATLFLHVTEASLWWVLPLAFTVLPLAAALMFYTSPKCGGSKSRYDELVNLLWKLQAEYGFAVFDMWNDPTMSREAIGEEKFAYYMKDAYHPYLTGYTEWWAPRFVEFFEKL